MKLTRTHLMIAGVIGVLIITGLLIFHLFHPATGKDTPVVAGGGSIYGKTNSTALSWTPHGTNIYSTSINPGAGNQYGIDYLTITGFHKDPSNPITGTKGWAISFSNPRSPNAVRFCSDATCSASQVLMDGSKNPSPCSPGSFNQSGPVYFGTALGGANLKPVQSGSVTYELDFDDTGPSCNPNGNCNKVKDATLETCNGTSYPKFNNCKEDSTGHQECTVTVGEP